MELKIVEEIVEEHGGSRGEVLSMLAEMQTAYGYLPEEALRRLATLTGRSLTDLYGVATFYRAFSLQPRGRHLVSICLGTACHVRGAQRIADEFSRQLGIDPGQTTSDREFSLETVNCLGACALGPTVVVDGRYFRHVTTADVRHILDQARNGCRSAGSGRDDTGFVLAAACPHCGHSLMDGAEAESGNPSIRVRLAYADGNADLELPPVYAEGGAQCRLDIPGQALTEWFCPHCGEPFAGDSGCTECGADMMVLAVGENAALHLCPRKGCPGHRLDLGAPTGRARSSKGSRPS
ncbi:MAG: NAD(P)H-dependent oxidoreductase subunit E [Lentisphaeria bacterium]|nr:NAD(P)H-dependent oxidoreductase subunit E [Lentisphaeria bacterium]